MKGGVLASLYLIVVLRLVELRMLQLRRSVTLSTDCCEQSQSPVAITQKFLGCLGRPDYSLISQRYQCELDALRWDSSSSKQAIDKIVQSCQEAMEGKGVCINLPNSSPHNLDS